MTDKNVVPDVVMNFDKATETEEEIVEEKSVETIERDTVSSVVGYVISLGPDAYKDAVKFPEGAWCKEGEWVLFGRYAGARFKIDGGELRLLNDDEILARIPDPEAVDY
jgi:co-chaperonin GroES (HSP10)